MTALRPGTSPPPVRMPMRLLTMPTSQDWNVVIIGGPLAIRHLWRTLGFGLRIADSLRQHSRLRSSSRLRKKGPAKAGPFLLLSGKRLALEIHTAHTAHSAATLRHASGTGIFLRNFGHHGFGGNQESRNRSNTDPFRGSCRRSPSHLRLR